MAKTKEPSPLAQALLKAIDAEKSADSEVELALAALDKARAASAEAHAAVREARKAADSELPQCVIHTQSRFDKTDMTASGVIIKRTASEIQVRVVGEVVVMRFRKSKRFADRWYLYPSPDSFSSVSKWVTFESETAAESLLS